MRLPLLAMFLLLVPQDQAGGPPATLVGTFADDYEATYAISATEWRHGSRNRYHITRWNADSSYLIARNDTANAGEKGRWTRIDWVALPQPAMAPYEWAYCYTAYDAESAEAAARVPSAKKDTPRTGCGGHPFTRMKRSSPAPGKAYDVR